MEGSMKRCIGIDLGKRYMDIAIKDAITGKVICFNAKTDLEGRKRLLKQLTPNDRIGIEACSLGFLIAKEIIREVGAEVLVLNPGQLAVIYQSTKKTDKEDSLKILRLIERFPNEELPIVKIPDEVEENNRAIVSESIFLKEERAALINRIHSIYVRAGVVTLKKQDLKTEKERAINKDKYLQNRFKIEAERLEGILKPIEEAIEMLEEEKRVSLEKSTDTPVLMSIPGVGPELGLAFISYIGDVGRFSSGSQVSNYIGLVPKVDSSGNITRYGHITKRGCKQIRRVAVQAAWALVRSQFGGELKAKYEDLSKRRGKKIAIVAIARKLVELMYVLVKKNQYYKYMPEEDRLAKLKYYKIKNIYKGA